MRIRFLLFATIPVLLLFAAATGSQAQSLVPPTPPPCQSTLPSIVPFTSLSTWGVVGPNAAGDYLIIGNIAGPINYTAVPLPSAINQQFCSTIPLLTSIAGRYFSYVPTAGERSGDFTAFASQLAEITGFPYPTGLFPAGATIWGWRVPAGETVFVSNNTGGQILRFDGNIGTLPGPFGNIPGFQVVASPGCSEISCFQPKNLTIGPDNKIYAADSTDDAIFRMDQSGGSFESILSCVEGTCPLSPKALAFSGSSAEDLYIVDGGVTATNDVFKIAGVGAVPFGGPVSSPIVVIPSACVETTFCTNGDQLDHGLTFDAHDNLLFSDLTSNTIWSSPPPYNSSLSTLAGITSPTTLALNRATGKVFVISGGVSGGEILPVGSTTPYYTFASPDTPAQMTFDEAGYLYLTTDQSMSSPMFGKVWRIDPTSGGATATLIADLNSLISSELISVDGAFGVAVPGTAGETQSTGLSSGGGSFNFGWPPGCTPAYDSTNTCIYSFGVAYPPGMFPDGSTAVVTPTATSEAAWALRTPPGNPYNGTQIAPVAGENGDGIIFSAFCTYQGAACPVPSGTLTYTTTTTWKSSQSSYCGSGPGLLKADPIGSDNWADVLNTCSTLSPDPTYGTKGTSTCSSSSCLSDWADVFDISGTAPTVTITTPPNGATYSINQAVDSDYACNPPAGTSPVTACTGTVANGAAINTSTLGVNTFLATADVSSGPSGHASSTYSVVSNVCLLYPLNGAVKLGADFPVKFYLCDLNGNDVSSSSVVVNATQLVFVSGSNTGDTTITDTGNSNPDNNFRFDSTLGPSGGYIFNFKTTNLAPHSAYSLQFTVNGASSPAYAVPLATK